jgi:hypothetical protein
MEYEGIGYSGDEYTLKGDSLALSTYRHGGGGGMDYLYVRQGTKKAEVAKVIGAYNDYLSDNGVSYSGLEYIYLDDDDIPELVYRDSRLLLDTLLTYSDGQVYATVLPDWGMGELSYRERTGEFMLSGVNGSFGHMDFYKYENGAVAHLGVAEHQTLEDGTEGFYIAEGEEYSGAETDKQTYTNFVNEFGSYDSTPSFENTYFNTASYELLQKY